MKFKNTLPYLLITAAIAAAMEIDLSLPGFPDIARHFGVSEEVVEGTISLNFLGFCLASLVYGPAADYFGRRPVMLFGNALFLVGSVGCTISPSIEGILVARFIQGIGAAACWVVAFTMLADAYEGDEATSWVGFMNAIITAVMALAPIAGGILNVYFGWRGSYAFIAIWTVVTATAITLWLPETRVGRPVRFRQVLSDYKYLLTSGRFIQASLVPTMLAGAYMAFVAVIPFLYRDELGLSLFEFSLHQAAIIGAFSFMSFQAHRIASKFGAQRAAIGGLLISVAATGTLFLQAFYMPLLPVWQVTPLMFLFAASCAVSFAIVFAESLALNPDKNGPASSLLMSMRTLVCAATIQLAGMLYDGTFLPTSFVVCACCVIALLLGRALYQQQQLPATA